MPLHAAADVGHAVVVRLLLEAAPEAATAADAEDWLPLHFAAAADHAAVVRLLLQTAPQAATATADGMTPLDLALSESCMRAARALLGAGPAPAVLASLAAAGQAARPLFADFLRAPGRLPLAADDWALVPSPCRGIKRALPATLASSPAEAAQVVQRLRVGETARLHTAALCLGRMGMPGAVAALVLARCI